MDGQISVAYGMALPESTPARSASVSGPPAGGFTASDLFSLSRWESAAIGTIIVISVAVYLDKLYEA